ncbi:MAG: molybdopterin-dependent oxidoreductase, partial [Coriobacteriales bacterium]|nr:molybdopterin-dependent oxidoreductase [Coriobacteriales bacterium]
MTDWKTVLEDGTEVVRTCAWSPPGCHPVGCGLRLFVKDGELVKVEGDPEHPITQGRLCPRCLALKEYIYHPDRIIYPMMRERKDRGLDRWQRVSWDEAWQAVKENTDRIRAEYGSNSIVYFSGTGRRGIDYTFNMCTHALGTAQNAYCQSGWSCYAPRGAITMATFGCGYPEVDWAGGYKDRYDNANYRIPEYILVWGKEPLKSNPDGFFGHSIIDMMKRGSKVIMVDPRMNWLATRAEHVLRLRPGTDTAVAMAMLNVIITEDLYDHDFVDCWCYGFDEFAERVKTMSPEDAEATSWVPAEQIRQIARILGTVKPWGLN